MASDFNTKVIEEFRGNGGKVGGHFAHMNLLLLTTTGSKTGNQHTSPVAYTKDGENFVVIASFGGAPEHPAWFNNLVAHPEVTVEVGKEKFEATAQVTGPEERKRLYASHSDVYPQFLDYLKKTDRDIPVVVLHPQA